MSLPVQPAVRSLGEKVVSVEWRQVFLLSRRRCINERRLVAGESGEPGLARLRATGLGFWLCFHARGIRDVGPCARSSKPSACIRGPIPTQLPRPERVAFLRYPECIVFLSQLIFLMLFLINSNQTPHTRNAGACVPSLDDHLVSTCWPNNENNLLSDSRLRIAGARPADCESGSDCRGGRLPLGMAFGVDFVWVRRRGRLRR
jgi:hypothetical protein